MSSKYERIDKVLRIAKMARIILAILGVLIGTSCIWSPNDLLIVFVKLEASILLAFVAACFVEEYPEKFVFDDE